MVFLKRPLLLAVASSALAAPPSPFDYTPVPACPPCFTSTIYTPGVCSKPRCTAPAVPCASFVGEAATTTATITKVVNTNVCSVLPTVTRPYPCPTAPACEIADLSCTTTTATHTETTTSLLLDCSATRTPWIQPLPSDYTPTPPLLPSYAWPSAKPPVEMDS
ncbi:hypothetical protein SEUCBS139899_002006 [Sporothrix eucalyptigena]|uniref:Uncharacterized protein n=1 Tax=Sporothrix eucalyptigena TaxID=1812306 RepID=A0ABP0CBV2_9PEZI